MSQAEWPDPALSPVGVVEASIAALQAGDSQTAWRFASPANKRATGRPRGGGGIHAPWIQRPLYTLLPTYAPLVRCRRYEITGGLPIGETQYRIRVRVWPSSWTDDARRDKGARDEAVTGRWVARTELQYVWLLSRQPLVRPACYEDDPLQAGVSAGPPGARHRPTPPLASLPRGPRSSPRLASIH